MDQIKEVLKGYILKEFLPGENPDELTDSTPLVATGRSGLFGYFEIG